MCHDPINSPIAFVQGDAGRPHLTQRLGTDVELRPRRAFGLDDGDHSLRDAGHELLVDPYRSRPGLGQHLGEHPSQLPMAKDPFGLDLPGDALLGFAAGEVLGLAGVEGRLLGQRELLHRCRRPFVVFLELGHQLRGPRRDLKPAR